MITVSTVGIGLSKKCFFFTNSLFWAHTLGFHYSLSWAHFEIFFKVKVIFVKVELKEKVVLNNFIYAAESAAA